MKILYITHLEYKYKPLLFFSLFMFVLFQTSCKKDWFDQKSDKNLAVPQTLQDFEFLLDAYETMVSTSTALGEVASDGHYMPEARWSTLSTTSATINMQRNAYTWNNTFVTYEKVLDWNRNYAKIFRCNLVLEGLKKLDPNREADRFNQIKGNALFHKAKCYYDLAQIYAQPYKSSSALTDLGVPLKHGVDMTELSKRSSVQETYDQIIANLTEAIDLLPLHPLYLTRGSKLGCYGLLARVYLVMGNYEKAGFYAGKVLEQKSSLIDFNTVPTSNANMGLFNDEVIFHGGHIAHTFIYTSGYIFIDQSLYDLYSNDDLRRSRFFNITSNGIVFKGRYNNTTTQFFGLATDEMYLIRAESYARTGKISLAMQDVNDLLRSRWAKNSDGSTKYIDQFAADETSALNIVLLERRKELLLRGLRWTDLRRLNQEDNFEITLTRTIGGQTYTLEPNSYKYTFPIPDDEISLSGIEQNPGWER